MSEKLYLALENTEYGKTLQNNARWSQFKPDWLAVNQWEYILGPDVNNYAHMGYMADLTDDYIKSAERLGSGFTKFDAQLLRDVAYIHDFAEAIDGDTPDPEKKFDKQAHEQERRSMIKVLGAVCVSGAEARDVAEKVLPVMQGRHFLSHHWRAIELIGYTETTRIAGIKATEMLELREALWLTPDQESELQANLEYMATNVHEINLRELERFSFIPMVREYLEGTNGPA